MTRRRIQTRPVEVTATSHLLELLYDDGENDDLLFCAGHGGSVEPGTAETALELATARRRASCWATLGEESDGSAFDRWHPPSTAMEPDRFPLLEQIADREFETVVSIHGLAEDELLVGGAIAEEVKETVAETLGEAVSVPVSVAGEGQYAGTHPENFVNWLAADAGGLQLELGATPRGTESRQCREAIHGLLDSGPLADQ